MPSWKGTFEVSLRVCARHASRTVNSIRYGRAHARPLRKHLIFQCAPFANGPTAETPLPPAGDTRLPASACTLLLHVMPPKIPPPADERCACGTSRPGDNRTSPASKCPHAMLSDSGARIVLRAGNRLIPRAPRGADTPQRAFRVSVLRTRGRHRVLNGPSVVRFWRIVRYCTHFAVQGRTGVHGGPPRSLRVPLAGINYPAC